jgi:hypothetical protein
MEIALNMLATGMSALRIIFAPKLLVKRLLLVASLQVFAALLAKLYSILHFIYYELGTLSMHTNVLCVCARWRMISSCPRLADVATAGSRQHSLRREMKRAPTYNDWAKFAKELDVVVGNDKWKAEKQSPYFDHKLIEQKTELFNHLMQTHDAEGLMWHLRKGLLRVRGFLEHSQVSCPQPA